MKINGEMKLLAILGAIVALGGGFLVFSNQGNEGKPPPPPPTPAPFDKARFDELASKTVHFKGKEDAQYTIIEFADFECPTCRRAYAQVLSTAEKIDSIRLGFHHFPLERMHPNAMAAATAAEAAAKQGKFWPMYDALFDGMEVTLDKNFFTYCAKRAALDLAKFEKDRADQELEMAVRKDQELGVQFGVDQTPTFFFYDAKAKEATMIVGLKALTEKLQGTIKLPKATGPQQSPGAPKGTPAAGPDPNVSQSVR